MSEQSDRQVTLITPDRWSILAHLGEVWANHDLVAFLVWRDIKVRYRQTFFSAARALVPPFFTMVVFTVIFGTSVKVRSDGQPYWAFSICAGGSELLFPGPHQRRQQCHQQCLADREGLFSAPVTTAIGDPVTAARSGGRPDIFVPVLAIAGIMPSVRLPLLIPLTAIATASATGLGAILAALNVRYRDVRHRFRCCCNWVFCHARGLSGQLGS
ncbi:hypothetical protein N8D56_13405 [Devosia sp. A8/3-2]|nr:hypothetical protein N8D56_13405 [Devosia sp. A8/3-2]